MATRIANIKVTQKDIIKNWWKLNRYQNGVIIIPPSNSPSISPSASVSPSNPD